MPSTAPETSDRITATRKGTRNQVGSSVARVPIGSPAMPARSSGSDPASSRPKVTSRTGARAPPRVFQKTIAAPEASRRW